MKINKEAQIIKLWFEIINFSIFNALFYYSGSHYRIMYILSLINSFLIGYYASERLYKIIDTKNVFLHFLVLISSFGVALIMTMTMMSAVKFTFK